MSPEARAVRSLAAIETSLYSPQVAPGRGGMINATLRMRIARVNVAQEVVQYPGAVRMILNHERGHLTSWDETIVPFLRRLGTNLETMIGSGTGVPTVQGVSSMLQQELPRLSDCLVDAAHAWDRSDWPQLRRAMVRVGVPADLGDS